MPGDGDSRESPSGCEPGSDLNLVADLGFTTYLVQSERVHQRMLSTGLWFSLTASAALVAAMYVIAPLIAAVLAIPEVAPVLRVLALSVMVSALSVVPITLLKRRMAFRTLAVQGAIAGGVGQVIAVVMALSGAGVWALVAQLLVTQSVGLALAWRAARWTPSRQFSAAEFRSMAAFGVRVSAVELVAVARSWAETFLIASSLGAVALGYLSIAQRLVQVVQDLSGSAILPVSVVVFAKIRESADRLVSAYLRALATIYALVTPVLTVVAVTAPLLVPLLFGDDWGASIPVAQALAVAAMLTLAATLDHGLFYGLGRPGAWLFYAIAIDVLTVVTTAVAVRYGLSAVAAAFVGVALVATTARWFLVSWVLSRPVAQVARPFWLGIVPTAVSALAGVIVLGWVSSWPVMMALIVTIATIVMVHLLVVRLVQSRVLVDCVDNLPVPRRAKQGLLQVLRLPRGC